MRAAAGALLLAALAFADRPVLPRPVVPVAWPVLPWTAWAGLVTGAYAVHLASFAWAAGKTSPEYGTKVRRAWLAATIAALFLIGAGISGEQGAWLLGAWPVSGSAAGGLALVVLALLRPSSSRGEEAWGRGLAVLGVCALFALPTLWMVVVSLGGHTLAPAWDHTFESYRSAVRALPPEAEWGLAPLRNTLWLVSLRVFGATLSSAIVAYGFARFRFPGRSVLFGLLLATLMLPGAVTMVPKFLLWRNLGFVDSLVPLWLPEFFGSAFSVFLLTRFFSTLPAQTEEAARLDGAGPLRIFASVSLPQAVPALGVVAVWTFVTSWSDFSGPLIYINSPGKMPVSYALQLASSEQGANAGVMMAMTTLAVLPVALVFALAQRAFAKNLQRNEQNG
ncbi:MAG: carbohydrate ABC transporter permease [Fimbriimonadaceae bacterium]|nr:carbohydrate ABC transporter permease [Fimbriimonadaceae bacterium]